MASFWSVEWGGEMASKMAVSVTHRETIPTELPSQLTDSEPGSLKFESKEVHPYWTADGTAHFSFQTSAMGCVVLKSSKGRACCLERNVEKH